MKNFASGFLRAVFTATAVWAVKHLLEQRQALIDRRPRRMVEGWENEGGALAPQPGSLETSQVPR